MGASSRWPSKVWAKDKIKEFIREARKKGYGILLFGGPNEIKEHEAFSGELKNEKIEIYRNNPRNTMKQFCALVNLCSAVVCSDSFALHISLAFKKPTTCLFFCTSPDEVEGYGFLKKIVSPFLYSFFPEKSDQYDEELVNSLSVQEVLSSINL